MLTLARQRLARAGLTVPDSTPPRSMAQRAEAHFGSSAAPLAQWLLQLEQLRYGGTPPSRAQLQALQRQARQLPWPTAQTPSMAPSA